jgi:glycosyltransferase involved in cell wall biosynthesis
MNNRSTIKQTIESIKNQTFENFEHIVIDGGSEDGTLDILKKAEHTYPLNWISETDCGIADALNKGLRRSKGRYIIIIQADDRLLELNTLETVYPILQSEQIDICSFPVILKHPFKGDQLKKPIPLLWWNHFKFIFRHQGCFVYRRVFKKIGGFRKRFKINMDYDFFYRALGRKVFVKFGKFPVALMGGGGIGSDPKYMIERLKEERLVQKLNEKNIFWRTVQFIFSSFYMKYKINSLSTRNKK